MDCENDRDKETRPDDGNDRSSSARHARRHSNSGQGSDEVGFTDTESFYDNSLSYKMDEKQNVDADADTGDYIPMEEDSHMQDVSSPPSSPPTKQDDRLVKPTSSVQPTLSANSSRAISEHHLANPTEEGSIECEDVSHHIDNNNYSSDEDDIKDDTDRLHSSKGSGRRSSSRDLSLRPRSSSDIPMRHNTLEDSKSNNFKRNRQPSDRSVVSRRSKSSSPPRRETPNKQYRRSFKDNGKGNRGRHSPRDKHYTGGPLRNRNSGGGRRSRSGSRERNPNNNNNNNSYRNATDKHNTNRNFRRGADKVGLPNQRPSSWSGYKNNRQYNVCFTEKETTDEHRSEQQTPHQTNPNSTNSRSVVQAENSHEEADSHLSSSNASCLTPGLLPGRTMIVSNSALAIREKQWEDSLRQQAQEFQQQKDYVVNTLMTLTKNVINWPTSTVMRPETHASGVGNQHNYMQTSFPTMNLATANNAPCAAASPFAPTYSHMSYPGASHSSLLQHPLLMLASPPNSTLMSVPSIHSSAMANNTGSLVSNHPTNGNQTGPNISSDHRGTSTDMSASKDPTVGKSS